MCSHAEKLGQIFCLFNCVTHTSLWPSNDNYGSSQIHPHWMLWNNWGMSVYQTPSDNFLLIIPGDKAASKDATLLKQFVQCGAIDYFHNWLGMLTVWRGERVVKVHLNISCNFCTFPSHLVVEGWLFLWVSSTDPLIFNLEEQSLVVLPCTCSYAISIFFLDKSSFLFSTSDDETRMVDTWFIP